MTVTDSGDILKTLAKMRLDGSRIFGLRQDLQELIIRQEVEPAGRKKQDVSLKTEQAS